MSMKDKNPKFSTDYLDETESDDGSESGGGQSGQIGFVAFYAPESSQRPPLLPNQQQRLMSEHIEKSLANIKDQKYTQEQYDNVKKGILPLSAVRENKETMGGRPPHLLDNKVQFSGVNRPTRTMNPTTNENEANELSLQNRPTNTPRFTPKLRPTGM